MEDADAGDDGPRIAKHCFVHPGAALADDDGRIREHDDLLGYRQLSERTIV